MKNTLVTVVIIARNEEVHIRAAVHSAQQQSHRNLEILVVDHASTDSTRDVVTSMAKSDKRVRLIALESDRGGPGRPLNEGLQQARGEWITILGGDDQLEPTACEDMLTFAVDEDLDVVLGRAQRIHADTTGVSTPWHGQLFSITRIARSVTDLPGLLFDTISASKLYRTQFLREHQIVFPEGMAYEDQPFTFDVYDNADGIGILARDVYRWMVRTAGERRSLTNSRFQIDNLRNRIAANRMVDERIERAKHPELLAAKAEKFFRHDLKLYVDELHERSDEYRVEALALIGDYLRSLPWDKMSNLDLGLRFVSGSLICGDLAAAQAAFRFVRDPQAIDVTFFIDGDVCYWIDPRTDDLARQLLDTTDLHLDEVPFGQYPLRFAISRCERAKDGITIDVEVQDPRARGSQLDITDARLQLIPTKIRRGLPLVQTGGLLPRRRPPSPTVSISLSPRASGELVGTGVLPLRKQEFRRLDRRVKWHIQWSAIRKDGQMHPAFLSPLLIPQQALNNPWRLGMKSTRFSSELDQLILVSKRGQLLVRQQAIPGTLADVRERLLLAMKRNQPLRRSGKKILKLVRKTKRRLRHRTNLLVFGMAALMPRRGDLVIFEAYEGKQYGDSPRVISEKLKTARPDLQQVWSYSRIPAKEAIPADMNSVKRGTIAYFVLLGRAGYWVDNFGMPRDLKKPRGTVYLQTWHGTPLKKLFFASPKVQAMPVEQQRQYERMVNRWDYLLSQSPYFTSTMSTSTRTTARLLETGTPRNDALLAMNPAEVRADVYEELSIKGERRTVLFAPTYRNAGQDSIEYRSLQLPELVKRAGDEFCFLIRSHYFRRGRAIPTSLTKALKDVSDYQPLEELLQASDVLVTDHSSVVFDWAVLGKPVIHYVPDLEYYESVSPQTYLSLRDMAPGPLVTNEEELLAELDQIDTWHERYGERLAAFVERFCPWDDGQAADRVIDVVWPKS